jgi:DNA-directed RNA polymerase specialized sigma24 family protein
MDEQDWLAERFEGHRSHLRAVAYRMLGSPSEADDAVQEAWFRLNRSDAGDPRRLMLCAVGTALGFRGRRV